VNVHLFSYGTLRQDDVQRALFGRAVAGAADALPGYRVATVTISDPAAIETSGFATHLILDPTGDPADRVEGVVLTLSEAELAIADSYEDAAYARIAARLESGIEAFVYVRAGEED
jgi:gamma-glutamylcyclotransferase (GGCT)/AIG2-like uncharacterized protein YtfP